MRAMGTASPVETGQTLGRYTLIEILGEGYLGSVWRGLDEGAGRAVIIRILCDGIKWEPEIEAAFQRECGALIALRHPNVAAMYEAGRERGIRFMVMESLGNRSLETMIARKAAMTVESRLSIMIQAAEGLEYAHRSGILHRNLEPSKIHVTADGTVKTRDFALAHVLKKHLPRPAVRWGTPIYLAPEQIENGLPDERSDIFALGTVFYEFLTGQHPFHDPNGNKALDNVLEPPRLPTFEKFPELPPGTWGILKTCLALDPRARYGSMQDVADACRELLTSLAEDTRLMLAELYAALPSLRPAAAQPGAPQSILQLHEAVQQLARGEKEAHYARLDGLMTRLIEQYPALQPGDGAGGPESAAGFDPAAVPDFAEPEDPPPEAAEPIDLRPADISPQPAAAPGVMGPIPEPPEPLSPVPADPASVEPPDPVPVETSPRPEPERSLPVAVAPSEDPAPLEPVGETVPSHGRSQRTAVWILALMLVAALLFAAWKAGTRFRQERARTAFASEAPTAAPFLPAPTPPLQPAAADPAAGDAAYHNAPEAHGTAKARPARAGAAAREEELQAEARERAAAREEDWERRVSALFGAGKYDEAGRLLEEWKTESPESAGALLAGARIGAMRLGLEAYSTAMARNHYPQALAALDEAAALNPSDSNLGGLRRQAEERQANARAVLTVLRLVRPGNLLLDGRPIGAQGEAHNLPVSVGSHTLEVEVDGRRVASRIEDYFEGQRMTLVYDSGQLRPMAESDRELIARREFLEQTHGFDAEHAHGLLRGSCRGTLAVDSMEIAYAPESGDHGFRLPLSLLKLGKIQGRQLDLLYSADSRRFQSFRFPDEQTAGRFVRTWNDLKTAR
jgi:serine/threonine-protein kinase